MTCVNAISLLTLLMAGYGNSCLQEDSRSKCDCLSDCVPHDQADWSKLDLFMPKDLVSVSIHGFNSGVREWKKYDKIDKSYDVTALIENAKFSRKELKSYRPAISDLNGPIGGYGGGVCIGVMRLKNRDGKELTIGVTLKGFILGKQYGTTRQTFYSPWLTKLVVRLLVLHDGRTTPEWLIDELSLIGV